MDERLRDAHIYNYYVLRLSCLLGLVLGGVLNRGQALWSAAPRISPLLWVDEHIGGGHDKLR